MKLHTVQILAGAVFAVYASAQVSVDVNLDVRHEVGGVSEFDREKYIVLHAGLRDNDWDSPEQRSSFLNDYDVYLGRNNGSLPWQLSQVDEHQTQSGWVDLADLQSNGDSARTTYGNDTTVHALEARANRMMIGGQMSMYPNGETNKTQKFALADYDALGNYFENYLSFFHGTGGADGEPKPMMVEVVNEPFVAANEHNTTRANISRMHTNVAAAIKNSHPDVLVGGYTAAHPQYEGHDGNFSHWNSNWKTFIDIAGEHMDFFSLHLYDNPDGTNVLHTQYRSGSNVEALLDMVEHYSMLTLGEVKPFNISEYGSLSVTNDAPYDPKNDWVDVRSFSTIMMQLLERPDRMLQAIPFMILKAEWGRSSNGYPYPTRLLYDEDELLGFPKDKDGPWLYTERIKWFELWKEVNGTRVDTVSSDPDIQVDAYVDGTNVFVAVSSLDHTGPQTVNLDLFGAAQSIDQVEVKHTYADPAGNVVMDHYTTNALTLITLPASSTAVIKYVYSSPVVQGETLEEAKYYATTYLQPITAGLPVAFSITNVNVSAEFGEAVLRLGVGRAHGKSLAPTLLVNGAQVVVPSDWRGYDQSTRDQFFGVLEIPVPYDLLQSNNTVSVEFGDTGGHISSVALQVFEFSGDFRNSLGIIPIDYHQMVGSDLVLGFTNGPTDSFFALYSKTNLLDASWTTIQSGLPTSGNGAGEVAASTALPVRFFRIRESGPPPVPVSGIDINPAAGTVGIGGSYRLHYTVSPTNATDKSVVWSSGNTNIATVAHGLVSGVANGSVIITGTTQDGGFSDSCTITVGSSELSLVFDDMNNYKNQTFTNDAPLKVTCFYDAGTGNSITADKDGVTYLLRQIDPGSGSWQVVRDFVATDPGVIGTQSGVSQAQIILPSDIIPSYDLPSGHFYYLFLILEASDGSTKTVATQPLYIENPDWVPVDEIEFTAPDYSDGTLDGQQNWNAESGWMVADSAGAGHAVTPDNASAAVLTNAVQLSVGQTYSLSINLQFGGTYSTPTNYVYAFLGGLKTSSAGASEGTGEVTTADANIQLYGNIDQYRLLNNYSGISGCSVIPGTLDAGDILQFDYELTLGADAASTTYTVRLQNLTDGSDTGTGTVNSYKVGQTTYPGIHPDLYSALTGSGAYGFFQSINPGARLSGLSGLQVNSVVVGGMP